MFLVLIQNKKKKNYDYVTPLIPMFIMYICNIWCSGVLLYFIKLNCQAFSDSLTLTRGAVDVELSLN